MDFLLKYAKSFLDTGVFFLLLGSVLVYWFDLIFNNREHNNKLGFLGILLSNLCLMVLLAVRWIESGYFPLSNLYESLVFFTWGSTCILLLLEFITKFTFLGAVIAPLSMLTMGFATLSLPEDMQQISPLVPALKSNWLMMHVSVMMLSYSTLVVGSLLAIVFLFLEYPKDLKAKASVEKISGISSITLGNQSSFLEKIDNLSYRIIGFGFPLLTIGIITGAIWANEAWGSYWSWDPKETWALITWLVFASYLHVRLTESQQSKSSAVLASVGFVVVWICYLGVNFLGKGLHSYGWAI
jgi:cytochrome c-type biogenesis protein CcsB